MSAPVFKVGDRVRCVFGGAELIAGQVYTVLSADPNNVTLEETAPTLWMACRFELVEPAPATVEYCAQCESPLRETTAEGCTKSSCSMRPMPRKWLFDPCPTCGIKLREARAIDRYSSSDGKRFCSKRCHDAAPAPTPTLAPRPLRVGDDITTSAGLSVYTVVGLQPRGPHWTTLRCRGRQGDESFHLEYAVSLGWTHADGAPIDVEETLRLLREGEKTPVQEPGTSSDPHRGYPPKCIKCDGPRTDHSTPGYERYCYDCWERAAQACNVEIPPAFSNTHERPHTPSLSPGAIRGPMGRR